MGAGMVSELPSKSRRGTDVLAAEGLFRRLYVLQRLPYGACVAVAGELHPRCARCRCTHSDSSPPHHRYCNVDNGRGGADAWRRLGWRGTVPPVLVAERQSHLHAAVPGFGEALGAGLFAFEPGLRDGSEARVFFGGGVKCVRRGVCAVAGQHRHLGRALRRCLQDYSPSIIGTALAVMTDAVLKVGLVLAGGWLHRWLSISQLRCVAALIDRRPRRACLTLLWP